MISLWRMKLLV